MYVLLTTVFLMGFEKNTSRNGTLQSIKKKHIRKLHTSIRNSNAPTHTHTDTHTNTHQHTNTHTHTVLSIVYRTHLLKEIDAVLSTRPWRRYSVVVRGAWLFTVSSWQQFTIRHSLHLYYIVVIHQRRRFIFYRRMSYTTSCLSYKDNLWFINDYFMIYVRVWESIHHCGTYEYFHWNLSVQTPQHYGNFLLILHI